MEYTIKIIHHLPILTTIISGFFAYFILERYRGRTISKHLLWWGLGVITYGIGTLLESYNTLFGWNLIVFKLWYIFGALLGGGPLAIGTIYLLFGKRAGDISVTLLITVVSITSVFVILSPIKYELIDTAIFNSKVLGWQDIRKVSPFINSLAALFLIGGAFYSAFKYLKIPNLRNRFTGNLLIAVGAILPGIGGYYSRLGFTEVLYVGEFVGIIFIWFGYKFCQKTEGNIFTSQDSQNSDISVVQPE